MKRPLLVSALLAACATLAALAPASATTDAPCTPIRSLPFTASAPGKYCVQRDLSLPMSPRYGMREHAPVAIRVLADDVELDLGGHTLDDDTIGIATNALAVLAVGRQRATVTNGTIRGFFIGVALMGDGNEAHVVERMRFEKIRYASVTMNAVKGYAVRDNVLVASGHGNSYYTPHALLLSGQGIVTRNVIDGVIPNVDPTKRRGTEAISVKDGDATIEGNVIRNAAVPEGDSYGIKVGRGATATIARNVIERFKFPVDYTPRDGAKWEGGVGNEITP